MNSFYQAEEEAIKKKEAAKKAKAEAKRKQEEDYQKFLLWKEEKRQEEEMKRRLEIEVDEQMREERVGKMLKEKEAEMKAKEEAEKVIEKPETIKKPRADRRDVEDDTEERLVFDGISLDPGSPIEGDSDEQDGDGGAKRRYRRRLRKEEGEADSEAEGNADKQMSATTTQSDSAQVGQKDFEQSSPSKKKSSSRDRSRSYSRSRSRSSETSRSSRGSRRSHSLSSSSLSEDEDRAVERLRRARRERVASIRSQHRSRKPAADIEDGEVDSEGEHFEPVTEDLSKYDIAGVLPDDQKPGLSDGIKDQKQESEADALSGGNAEPSHAEKDAAPTESNLHVKDPEVINQVINQVQSESQVLESDVKENDGVCETPATGADVASMQDKSSSATGADVASMQDKSSSATGADVASMQEKSTSELEVKLDAEPPMLAPLPELPKPPSATARQLSVKPPKRRQRLTSPVMIKDDSDQENLFSSDEEDSTVDPSKRKKLGRIVSASKTTSAVSGNPSHEGGDTEETTEEREMQLKSEAEEAERRQKEERLRKQRIRRMQAFRLHTEIGSDNDDDVHNASDDNETDDKVQSRKASSSTESLEAKKKAQDFYKSFYEEEEKAKLAEEKKKQEQAEEKKKQEEEEEAKKSDTVGSEVPERNEPKSGIEEQSSSSSDPKLNASLNAFVPEEDSGRNKGPPKESTLMEGVGFWSKLCESQGDFEEPKQADSLKPSDEILQKTTLMERQSDERSQAVASGSRDRPNKQMVDRQQEELESVTWADRWLKDKKVQKVVKHSKVGLFNLLR
jgi:hypothetical protein